MQNSSDVSQNCVKEFWLLISRSLLLTKFAVFSVTFVTLILEPLLKSETIYLIELFVK